MSRREFVQAGAAAGTAAALGGRLAAGQEKSPAVRVGIVGVGSRGRGLIPTLLQLPGVEVRAVCDIVADSAAQAQQMVEQLSGKRPEAYTKDETDFRRLVERDDLDAVITATPWEWHTPVAVAAMRAGKYAGVEVPAGITVEECWQLVRTSEETRVPCMMLENVCYFRNALTILRMVREAVFGDMLHCEAGYQHDCRFLMFTEQGELTWRGRHVAEKNGNLYPTHPVGPVAQWLNINRGDRFTVLSSMSTPSKGLKHYAARKFGQDHALAKRDYALGDVNTTLLKTANGLTVTLYFDLQTYRPYDLIFRVQGVKGIYLGTHDKVCIEGLTPEPEQWEPFEPYMEKYAHPLWEDLKKEAEKSGGHGGADYITMYEFVKAVRNKTPTPQDVYDAATWSVIVPLSVESVAKGGQPVEFPDFTKGKWKGNPPLPVYGA
jgi:predicted dehydrogenase